MLKKLFVHEWKSSWKLLTGVNIVVLLLTIIGMFTMHNDVWNNAERAPLIMVSLVLYTMFYTIAIASLAMCISIYFTYRFYKNLYTDQGYLMHTLPVTTHQQILAKGLVAISWTLISMFVELVSIVSILLTMASSSGEEVLDVIIKGIREITVSGPMIYIVVSLLMFMLSGLVMATLMGYAAVSIGQLFNKHRLGMAIVIYMGLYMIVQVLSSYMTIPISASMVRVNSEQEALLHMGNIFMGMFVFTSVLAGVLYFITYYIMEHKLNLE